MLHICTFVKTGTYFIFPSLSLNLNWVVAFTNFAEAEIAKYRTSMLYRPTTRQATVWTSESPGRKCRPHEQLLDRSIELRCNELCGAVSSSRRNRSLDISQSSSRRLEWGEFCLELRAVGRCILAMCNDWLCRSEFSRVFNDTIFKTISFCCIAGLFILPGQLPVNTLNGRK